MIRPGCLVAVVLLAPDGILYLLFALLLSVLVFDPDAAAVGRLDLRSSGGGVGCFCMQLRGQDCLFPLLFLCSVLTGRCCRCRDPRMPQDLRELFRSSCWESDAVETIGLDIVAVSSLDAQLWTILAALL